ncbi:MAG: phosphate regulon sensor protein PhoR [Neisseriaceae bacterium]|nr:phosphate regulon sensor protein PhoR [Neisseriaceae bacterium]
MFYKHNGLIFSSIVILSAILVCLAPWLAWGIGVLALALVFWSQQRLFRRFLSQLERDQDINEKETQGIWRELAYHVNRTRKKRERHLMTEKQVLKDWLVAMNAAPFGMVVLNQYNQIEWLNDSAANQFDLNLVRDQTQTITFLMRHPDFVRYVERQNYQEVLTLKQNNKLISLQFMPYGAEQHLMVSQDITDAQQLEQTRASFAANASHELKTPLTVLRGFIETLQNLPVNEAQRQQFLDKMVNQTQRMQSIIEALLMLARLESNTVVIESKAIDFNVIFSLLEQEAYDTAPQQSLVFDLPSDLPVVLGDAGLLLMACHNLLSNALRYTPEGRKITVSAFVSPCGRFAFQVSDTGMGVPSEFLPRLTERFYRADKIHHRATGGNGLGLAIVKHIALRHYGDLQLKSQWGQGFSATLLLPVQST